MSWGRFLLPAGVDARERMGKGCEQDGRNWAGGGGGVMTD